MIYHLIKSNSMAKLGALHLTKHTGAKHTATVIYCHGSGKKNQISLINFVQYLFLHY